MPIEIRELIIKATITDQSDKGKKKSAVSPDDKEEIISECVEQVVKIINERNER